MYIKVFTRFFFFEVLVRFFNEVFFDEVLVKFFFWWVLVRFFLTRFSDEVFFDEVFFDKVLFLMMFFFDEVFYTGFDGVFYNVFYKILTMFWWCLWRSFWRRFWRDFFLFINPEHAYLRTYIFFTCNSTNPWIHKDHIITYRYRDIFCHNIIFLLESW